MRLQTGKVEALVCRSSKRLGNTFPRPSRPLVHNILHHTRLLPPAYRPAIMAKETSKLYFCMHWRVAPPRAKLWLEISVMADTRAVVGLLET